MFGRIRRVDQTAWVPWHSSRSTFPSIDQRRRSKVDQEVEQEIVGLHRSSLWDPVAAAVQYDRSAADRE